MSKTNNNKRLIIILSILLIILICIPVFFIIKSNNRNHQNELNEKVPIKDTNKEENNSSDKTENKETNNNDTENKENNNIENNNKEQENPSKPTNNGSTNNSDVKPNNENSSANNNTSSNNNSNNSNNTNNATNNNQGNTDSNKNENNTPNPPVVNEDKNNILRKNIESSYGVKILYGDEIGNYQPKRINPVKLTDEVEITNYLNRVNTELAKYPKGFFNDFNKKGMPLTIYLIKSANGAFSGFTDYQFMNNIKITLATDFNFEYTLHHEIMHYIDCYLNIVMYPNNPYDDYEKLNPESFTYGNAKSEEIYNMGTNQRGAYFISQYGSSSVNEDRAEVFKYMMARAYAPIGCFESGETLNKKARLISNQIKTYFPSVNSTAHWDRFVK